MAGIAPPAVAQVGIAPPWSFASAFVGLALLLVFLHFLTCWLSRGDTTLKPYERGLWPGVIGSDGRVSTSKLQFAMWTYAIAAVFIGFLLQGDASAIQSQFQAQYLLLLGIPAVGAAGAKLITTSKVTGGVIDKPAVEDTPGDNADLPDPAQAVQQAVGGDSGGVDVGDLQYLVFNLVALVYFFAALAHDPSSLPVIPDTLMGLTSASAAGYLGKKAVQSYVPTITSVVPSTVAQGSAFKVLGANFTGPSSPPATTDDSSRGIIVTVGGADAKPVDASVDGELVVTAPPGIISGPTTLTVITAGGVSTDPASLTLSPGITILAVRPASIVIGSAATTLRVDISIPAYAGALPGAGMPAPWITLGGVALTTDFAPAPGVSGYFTLNAQVSDAQVTPLGVPEGGAMLTANTVQGLQSDPQNVTVHYGP
jgi:hypothetical protein